MNIRIDDELKLEIDRLADNLWISTNQLVNLKLREFVDEGTINIDIYKKDNKKLNKLNSVYKA